MLSLVLPELKVRKLETYLETTHSLYSAVAYSPPVGNSTSLSFLSTIPSRCSAFYSWRDTFICITSCDSYNHLVQYYFLWSIIIFHLDCCNSLQTFCQFLSCPIYFPAVLPSATSRTLILSAYIRWLAPQPLQGKIWSSMWHETPFGLRVLIYLHCTLPLPQSYNHTRHLYGLQNICFLSTFMVMAT